MSALNYMQMQYLRVVSDCGDKVDRLDSDSVLNLAMRITNGWIVLAKNILDIGWLMTDVICHNLTCR